MSQQAMNANPRTIDPSRYRTSFLRLVKAEIRKMTSLRSTWITWVVFVVMGALITGGIASQADHGKVPMEAITGGISLYILLTFVLGALAVTSEYSSNTMRTTTLTAGSRPSLMLAKVCGTALLLIAAMLVFAGVLLAVGQVFSAEGWDFYSIQVRSLLFFILGTVIGGLLAVGFGYILRSTAGTITLLVAIVPLSPMLALIPVSFFRETLPRYLPSGLFRAFTTTDDVLLQGTFSAGTALAIWGLYALIVLAGGMVRYVRSDV